MKSPKKGGSKGLILVFDLDETITNTEYPVTFNRNILEILIKASKLRDKGLGVDAIFLLTNNSDKEYVAAIDDALTIHIESIGKYTGDDKMPEKDYFFDFIMTRNHPFRYKEMKRINDVKDMCMITGVKYDSIEDIMSRTYFFDDQEHILKQQMESWFDGKYADHYIHIKPGFTGRKNVIDETDFNPIESALNNLSGGKRSTYKKRKTLKKSK